MSFVRTDTYPGTAIPFTAPPTTYAWTSPSQDTTAKRIDELVAANLKLVDAVLRLAQLLAEKETSK